MSSWRCIDGKWRFAKKPKRKKSLKGTVPNKKWFNLGLAISGATMQPGEVRTQFEIACFVSAAIEVMTGRERPVVRQRIQQIEEQALRKCRHPERIKTLR